MKSVAKNHILNNSCCLNSVDGRTNAKTESPLSELPPDHTKQIKRLNRTIGQLQGIQRMIEERRYCPEVLIQLKAVTGALKTIEMSILESHLHSCVAGSFNQPSQKDASKKISELLDLIKRM